MAFDDKKEPKKEEIKKPVKAEEIKKIIPHTLTK